MSSTSAALVRTQAVSPELGVTGFLLGDRDLPRRLVGAGYRPAARHVSAVYPSPRSRYGRVTCRVPSASRDRVASTGVSCVRAGSSAATAHEGGQEGADAAGAGAEERQQREQHPDRRRRPPHRRCSGRPEPGRPAAGWPARPAVRLDGPPRPVAEHPVDLGQQPVGLAGFLGVGHGSMVPRRRAVCRACRGGSPSSASTNASGSNGARSSAPSPRPTSLTGTPSSRWTATTMPPLAVPSSLVSTMPVTSTTSANTRAWTRPFWPVVASSTSSTSSTGPLLLDDPLDLAELVHQADLVLQPAGGVDEHDVVAAVGALLDGVERDAGRVAALRAADDGRADPLAPGRAAGRRRRRGTCRRRRAARCGRRRPAPGPACRRWWSCRCR